MRKNTFWVYPKFQTHSLIFFRAWVSCEVYDVITSVVGTRYDAISHKNFRFSILRNIHKNLGYSNPVLFGRNPIFQNPHFWSQHNSKNSVFHCSERDFQACFIISFCTAINQRNMWWNWFHWSKIVISDSISSSLKLIDSWS